MDSFGGFLIHRKYSSACHLRLPYKAMEEAETPPSVSASARLQRGVRQFHFACCCFKRLLCYYTEQGAQKSTFQQRTKEKQNVAVNVGVGRRGNESEILGEGPSPENNIGTHFCPFVRPTLSRKECRVAKIVVSGVELWL